MHSVLRRCLELGESPVVIARVAMTLERHAFGLSLTMIEIGVDEEGQLQREDMEFDARQFLRDVSIFIE